MSVPDRDELRATLAAFDDRRKKIVGGLIAVMIQNPMKVVEREWIVEQFTHVTLLAGDFEGVGGVQEGVDVVQEYVRANIDDVLNTCYTLFQIVAADMSELDENERDVERAVAQALSYF